MPIFFPLILPVGFRRRLTSVFCPLKTEWEGGMGHVSYVIKPLSSVKENTEIRNIALIVFDMGEQIYTNQKDPHDPGQEDLDGDGIGDACDTLTCGNGRLESPEACDDGNLDDFDGCSSACSLLSAP